MFQSVSMLSQQDAARLASSRFAMEFISGHSVVAAGGLAVSQVSMTWETAPHLVLDKSKPACPVSILFEEAEETWSFFLQTSTGKVELLKSFCCHPDDTLVETPKGRSSAPRRLDHSSWTGPVASRRARPNVMARAEHQCHALINEIQSLHVTVNIYVYIYLYMYICIHVLLCIICLFIYTTHMSDCIYIYICYQIYTYVIICYHMLP